MEGPPIHGNASHRWMGGDYLWTAGSMSGMQHMRQACALPREKMNRLQILILEVHAAFVTIVACGEEVEDDEVLLQARELLSPMQALTSFSTEAVGSDRHRCGSGKLLI